MFRATRPIPARSRGNSGPTKDRRHSAEVEVRYRDFEETKLRAWGGLEFSFDIPSDAHDKRISDLPGGTSYGNLERRQETWRAGGGGRFQAPAAKGSARKGASCAQHHDGSVEQHSHASRRATIPLQSSILPEIAEIACVSLTSNSVPE